MHILNMKLRYMFPFKKKNNTGFVQEKPDV